MPLKELKTKYGGTKARESINRAIRAECPGGGECLDALELLHHMCERHGWEDARGRQTELAVAYDRIARIGPASRTPPPAASGR